MWGGGVLPGRIRLSGQRTTSQSPPRSTQLATSSCPPGTNVTAQARCSTLLDRRTRCVVPQAACEFVCVWVMVLAGATWGRYRSGELGDEGQRPSRGERAEDQCRVDRSLCVTHVRIYRAPEQDYEVGHRLGLGRPLTGHADVTVQCAAEIILGHGDALRDRRRPALGRAAPRRRPIGVESCPVPLDPGQQVGRRRLCRGSWHGGAPLSARHAPSTAQACLLDCGRCCWSLRHGSPDPRRRFRDLPTKLRAAILRLHPGWCRALPAGWSAATRNY